MSTKHKLSDMTGYEPEAVMVVERKEYEALKTLNAELLAALKEARDWIAEAREVAITPDVKGIRNLAKAVRLVDRCDTAIAKTEGR